MRRLKMFTEIKNVLAFGTFHLTLVGCELATVNDKAGEAIWASGNAVHD